MARPLAFDRDQVLNQALHLFWRKGYQGTSIKDLIQATKLQPGSIYGTFGNKKSLFSSALNCYFNKNLEMLKRAQEQHSEYPLKALEEFITEAVIPKNQEQDPPGCFISKSLLELSDLDADLKDMLLQMLQKVEDIFTTLIREAQGQNQIHPDQDPQVLASYLVSTIHGLQVYSFASKDVTVKKDMIQHVIQGLSLKH